MDRLERQLCRKGRIEPKTRAFLLPLSWLRRWYPAHDNLGSPRSVSQLGDEEIRDRGDFRGPGARRGRYEVETAFRHAPISENRFETPVGKVFGCNEFRNLGDCQPTEHSRYQGLCTRSSQQSRRCDRGFLARYPMREVPGVEL